MAHYRLRNKSNYDMGLMSNLINEFFPYSHQQLGFDKPVNIVLMSDEQNASDPLGKTAYYEPSTHTVTLFVDHRHPKDILRSLSHELVHHTQNCAGHFENSGGTEEGYAQSDPHLREMEVEAFTSGNMVFRDWCDTSKHLVQKQLFETNYRKQRSFVMKLDKKELKERIKDIIKEKLEEGPDEGVMSGLKSAAGAVKRSFTGEAPPWDEKKYFEKWDELKDMILAARDQGILDREQIKMAGTALDTLMVLTGSPERRAANPPIDIMSDPEEVAEGEEELEESPGNKRGPHAKQGRPGTPESGKKPRGTLGPLKEDAPLKEWWDNSLYNRLLKEWVKK